jgi:hypothetical protein
MRRYDSAGPSPQRLRPSAIPLLCAVALCTCASSSGGGARFVAASSETVVRVTEERQSEVAHVIYVENRSSEIVRVTSYRLEQCANVRERCQVQPVNIEIRPNGRRQVLVVHPESPNRGFSYRFGFSWSSTRAPE